MKQLIYLLSVFMIILLSCNKKQEQQEQEVVKDYKAKLVNPIALDSTLSVEYLNSIWNDKALFEFQNKAKLLVIYQYSDLTEKDTMYVVLYNKMNQPVSIERKDYPNRDTKRFYYNDKGALVLMVNNYTDINDNTYPIIKRYNYDLYGNLVSEYEYEIVSDKYMFSSFSEYKYEVKEDLVVVEKSKLYHFSGSYFKEKTYMEFDRDDRILNKIKKSPVHLLGNKEIETVYEYSYKTTPSGTFLSSVKRSTASDNSQLNEYFIRDSIGRITEELKQTKGKQLFESEKKLFVYSNSGETVEIIHPAKSISLTGQIIENTKSDGIQKKQVLKFDHYGNLVYEKSTDKAEERAKNHTMRIDYDYDKFGNWIHRKKYYTQLGDFQFRGVSEDNLAEYNLIREFEYVNENTIFEEIEIPEPDLEAEQLRLKILNEHNF